ncbi:HalOD1 output domain-containing protein [Halomicrococcus sp. NG-SE-24]|uniref:HalOD1 output domain-containing protein n=1 Tax=Halomicrococcus sp. NG-SE-24 TaxID=3436928 RepID=UPI003D95763F
MSDRPTTEVASPEYDPDTKTYCVDYDHESVPPSVVIPAAIRDITGTERTELDPLYWTVDGDALDELFQPAVEGDVRANGKVAFSYHGYEVTVFERGRIEFRRDDETERPRASTESNGG